MTVGLEFNTDDGHLQLAVGMVFFRHIHTEVMLSGASGWAQFGSNGSYKDLTLAGLTLADVPMIALSSTGGTWAKLISTSGGLTWRIYRIGSVNVTVYVFNTTPVPTDPGYGMILYDPSGSGVIRWSSEYRIANPIGTFDENGYTGLDRTGRQCAHVPQKQGTSQYLQFSKAGYGSCQIGSMLGYQFYQSTGWGRTAVVCSGSNLSALNLALQTSNIPYMCSPQPTLPASTASESPSFRSLILDVTGL